MQRTEVTETPEYLQTLFELNKKFEEQEEAKEKAGVQSELSRPPALPILSTTQAGRKITRQKLMLARKDKSRRGGLRPAIFHEEALLRFSMVGIARRIKSPVP